MATPAYTSTTLTMKLREVTKSLLLKSMRYAFETVHSAGFAYTRAHSQASNDAAQAKVEDNRDHDQPPFDNEYSEPLIYETRDIEVEHEEAVVDFGCVDDEEAQTRLEESSQNVLRRHQDQLEGTEDYGQVGSSLADYSRTSTSETTETQVFTFTRARRRSPPVREEVHQDVDIDVDANAGAETDADADDDSDPLEEVLPDVVKIVSSDAKAAARAAAILKLVSWSTLCICMS